MGPELYISRPGESGLHVTKALDFGHFLREIAKLLRRSVIDRSRSVMTGPATLLAGLDVGPHPGALPVVIRAEFGWQV